MSESINPVVRFSVHILKSDTKREKTRFQCVCGLFLFDSDERESNVARTETRDCVFPVSI